MCVTNTTGRRPQPVSFNASQVGLSSSLLVNFEPPKPFYQPSLPALFQPQVSAEVVVDAPKARSKRRRKPQKPGKTAKNQERHFVVHNYHDHANDTEGSVEAEEDQRRRGGVSIAFPLKLHAVLDQVEADGLAHVVSWAPHGRCFIIHKPKEFVDHIMPHYFRQSKLTSFQRQLNLYGFCRLTRGTDAGGYYHELFLRGRVFLCKRMMRTKVKGTKFKAASSPDGEPDFYTMPPVSFQHVTPHNSDEEMSAGSYQHPFAQRTILPDPSGYAQPLSVQYNGTMVAQSDFDAEADRVLDEAVNDLFMDMTSDSLDFSPEFDPSFNIEDDTQLGYMLEKLLED